MRRFALASLLLPLVQAPLSAQISFDKGFLQGAALDLPTSIQFGPDGRLYVGEQEGLIRAFTVTQVGNAFSVTATEVINLIPQIPNHDDDGTPNPSIAHRQVTGLLVAGTAADPVLYVSSSDPRIGAGGSGTDLDLDTNSGVVSRLYKSGGVWQRQDLVRGLPRSEENHGPNGMQLDPATNMLYLAQGGHTNMGAPSNNFALTPEFALSAAILSIDLDAIGSNTYDLPTLDDEDRAGAVDLNDPFGGNDGKNQAMLVAGGPVQIHSPGWRNPYDVVLTESGRLYAIDNGPNGGWGGEPVYSGGNCTNGVAEPGATHGDGLHYIPAAGYYAGHPNPTRANTLNTFNPTNPQSPVWTANPVECEYRAPGAANGALAVWGSSTNGIAEYTSTAFGGAMEGDLLLISLSQHLRRVKLNAAGDGAVLVEDLFSSVGSGSIDVTTLGDSAPFPGTIWVANRTGNSIVVFSPNELLPCSGAYDLGLDEDLDGYSNADEIDNGTDPCSSGDVPADQDGDLLSDLNDPDDDDDGIADHLDPFAIDPTNGLALVPPFALGWETDVAGKGGILNLGFSGLMSNGVDDYLDQFDPAALTAGGAAGVFTVETVSAGSANGAVNDQENAFQVGFQLPAKGAAFTARTVIAAPFLGITPTADQSIGLFLGTGDQDNFVSLSVTGTGVELRSEVGGTPGATQSQALALPGPAEVELLLEVDPSASTVTALFGLDGAAPTALAGGPQTIPQSWLSGQVLAVGILSTAGGGGSFAATWDELEIIAPPPPVRVNAGGAAIDDWTSDDGLVSGSPAAYTSALSVVPDGTVPLATPPDMFRSERYTNGQDMTWNFPLPAGTTYEVRLYFAEVYFASAGARVFDVYVEDNLVLDDYDVFADVGANIGTMKTFEVTPTDADVEVRLAPVLQNAKISGIEIVEVPAQVPGQVELYGTDAGGANQGTLSAPTAPVLGNSTMIELSNLNGSTVGLLAFSSGRADVPLLGGTLLITLPPVADVVAVPLSGGYGSIALNLPYIPEHAGLSFTCQAAALDTAAALGWRFTNGLELTIGN
ncbi:MAG: malectin domain-containing carbohydrate-binding protein [Planctomycetota bacterium]